MPTFLAECPHCGGEKVGFSMNYQNRILNASPMIASHRIIVFAQCGGCERGLIVEYDNRGQATKNTPMDCPSDPESFGWVKNASYPASTPTRVPAHANDQLKRFFAQAGGALKRGDWDASGAMSRKVIDVSTKQMLGEESKNYHNIKGRIDALAAKGSITSDLKDWAHEIRLGGNDAAHDEDPYTETEANELFEFADLYLTYVYTLPGRLKERRDRSAAEKKSAA